MGQKLKFVLSDLHLGAGHTGVGRNPLEDFTASKELVAFLHEIAQESCQEDKEIELIINGDFFEFLQVPAVDKFEPTVPYPAEAYLDSSEAASIKRLNIIVKGHQDIFSALSDFMHVESPQRHITIIKGNHDVSLFWPGVKAHLREILGASGARASLLRFADEFVSREKIYVEHGHQHAEKINGFHDSFDPRSVEDPTQLHYPAGSRFVIDFLNEVERRRQFVDQIKPVTALIWYALKWDFEFASRALAAFIRHTPVLAAGPADGRTEIFPPAEQSLFDLEDLEDLEKRRELARQYATDPGFRRQFHQQIQQYLDETMAGDRNVIGLSRSYVSDDPLEMGRLHQGQQRELLRRAAEKIADQERARVVIFGHTHEPVEELLAHGSLYINTGSWIKDFTNESVESWKKLFHGSQAQTGQSHLFPYVRIEYDENDNPQAQLLYFKKINPVVILPPAEALAGQKVKDQNFFEKNFQWLFRLLRTSS